ncbi:Retrovirus-related Pol polyprotein from transposon 297 family [Cucumis melo var. makuwa]|uniref:Retrovirus-related Pol polyprotein from transposon 297 family n=1 Tax=Cucumis melo var. makuwa TaxID=1194695 RepID=A0A5D3CW21_CUCMM|nr:Retrovirus-related Pol polyprotein from transposon 297 family [Cucumis melo var. makuwa]TYK15448.1 Retrovirus-related Pol polyprotein from transposon 297 family [Cucumis melo var. makuwa]
MAENSKKISSRTLDSNNSSSYDNSVEEQVNLLTKLFASFVKGKVPKVVSCGVYGLLGHHNDQYPELKEISAMEGFRRNDSHSNTYNSYWRDHPNLRWGPQEPKPTNTSSSSSSSQGLLSVEFDGNVVSCSIFDDVKSSNVHVSLCALDTLESLKKLEEHDKFNELIDQATLEHVENEFAKNKPSDDDLSIFLDFVTSVNDEYVLVDNIATNEHVPENDFVSSNEHDQGRNIKDDSEHILKSIVIENDHDTSIHIKNFEKENDLEKDYCEVSLHKECESSNTNELTRPLQENGIKLKVLPSHLKYVFLGEKNTYHVIISKELTKEQEARLLETLKIHRQAIGAKNKIQPQRRVNPNLKEFVKKEVFKLKDVGIIYPVPHSTWVSLIYVVPKKTGMTIVENSQGKFVHTRVSK